MKNEIHQLTTDLHERDTTVAGVTEKASTMERTLRDQNEILDRKTAELEVWDILRWIAFHKLWSQWAYLIINDKWLAICLRHTLQMEHMETTHPTPPPLPLTHPYLHLSHGSILIATFAYTLSQWLVMYKWAITIVLWCSANELRTRDPIFLRNAVESHIYGHQAFQKSMAVKEGNLCHQRKDKFVRHKIPPHSFLEIVLWLQCKMEKYFTHYFGRPGGHIYCPM